MGEMPDYALSIMQPWSWLIVNGHKDVENRDWKPWNRGLKFRGPVAIHAGKRLDCDADEDLREGYHPATNAPHSFNVPERYDCGGIVGVAEIVDCVTTSDSPWFVGPYAFVIRNARPVPFIPCKGQLGFFDWRHTTEPRHG